MLGVFDSGLGGLTVVRRLRAALPEEDIVFFADQANVPYGDRSDDELRRLLAANVAFLEGQGVDVIVMGCNTTCSTAARFGWPPARVPILDLIEAAADAVVASGANRISVLATAATVRSGAYGNAIRRRTERVIVEEVAAPALVPLIEAGHVDDRAARDAVAAACARLAVGPDALVFGCTHYPILDPLFAAALGVQVRRIDPAIAQADRAVAFARARVTVPQRRERGHTRYITSGIRGDFATAVESIVGPLNDVEQVEEQRH